jgi:hypothetical protein
MKKIILILVVFWAVVGYSQAYKGKGDVKGQVGLTLQDGGTGIGVSTDYGLGSNISVGLVVGYMLNVDKIGEVKPKFEDRFDFKARFNANIGKVFKLDDHIDIYPGLHLGLRNFGGHLGFRYFFTDGFGVYSELSTPWAQYDSDVTGFENYNNQFMITVGASFNLD